MSASGKNSGSNLFEVDLHEITEAEYAELPELTDEEFARAKVHHAGRPAHEPPPPIDIGANRRFSTRLDPEIQARFASSGPGWQGRMNTFLLRNEVVLKMIVEFEDAIGDMKKLIEQLRTGGVRPVTESVEVSIEKVERNISLNRETARALREKLVWEPTELVG